MKENDNSFVTIKRYEKKRRREEECHLGRKIGKHVGNLCPVVQAGEEKGKDSKEW